MSAYRWTDGRVARLKKLFDDGCSVNEMAEVLSEPENGLHFETQTIRYQLYTRGMSVAARDGKRKAAKDAAEQPSGPDPSVLAEQGKTAPGDRRSGFDCYPPEGHSTVTLGERKSNQCSFPYDTPEGDVVYCGRVVEEDKPYCLVHCDVIYRREERAPETEEAQELVA